MRLVAFLVIGLVAGLIGSFVGGTLAALIFDRDLGLSASGLIGPVVGAIIVLLLWRAARRTQGHGLVGGRALLVGQAHAVERDPELAKPVLHQPFLAVG
jgi:hypothetical protein